MGHEASNTFCIDRFYFCNYVFMYVLTGCFHVIQYQKHHKLQEGQGIIMDLRDKHKYYCDSKINTEILWFHFRGLPCDSMIQLLSKIDKMPYIFVNKNAVNDVYQCFDIMIQKKPYFEFKLSALIYELLIKWTSPEVQLFFHKENEGESFLLASIQSYIESNINRRITLNELADYVHMSKYHFCRVFSEQFHISPIQYILQLKVNISKRHLIYTSDSIQTIAQDLGFTDQCHYSKMFKQITNQTPSEYRKKSTFI
jgi:AraC-like DNA-binding protein